MRRTLAAVALVVLGACSGGSGDGEPLQRAEEATADGRDALRDYLGLTAQPPAGNITSWQAFLARKKEGVVPLRSAYDRWRTAVDSAVEDGVDDVDGLSTDKLREYLNTAGAWVNDQEEQVRLDSQCLNIAGNDYDRFLSCRAGVIEQNAAIWNATAARHRQLARELGFV